MALLVDSRTARDNLAIQDDLTQKMHSLESQTIAWMATATTLHGSVEAADQSVVLALRQQLISKLTTAVTI